MSFKRLHFAVFGLGIALCAGAVPAKRGLRTVTQPDGTKIQVELVGDEHAHFTVTPDRKLVTLDADGYYRYARLATDGSLRSTGVEVGKATAEAQTLDESAFSLRASAARAQRKALPQSGLGLFTTKFPSKGNVKGLVILVEYKDKKFTVADPKAFYTAMLNEKGFSQYSGTGSARDYFIENSNSLFTPQFDVYGPFTLANNMAYYGGNDMMGNDKAPEEMIVEGCRGLDAEINFADYDCDGDGYVDNVFVFYAGQGEASYGPATSVWPHQWEIEEAGKTLILDGKQINRYACSNEWEETRPDGVGTFIHEFSHVMGLPDLYQTDGGSSCPTPNEWSTMDYGPYNNDGRTPPAYSSFERNALQWMEPTLITDAANLSIDHILKSNQGYIIQTEKPNEFFLIENRQQSGWDKYLPGHGMLIWHIDFNQGIWNNNAVNNTRTHQYVQIEPANNSTTNYQGWAFPSGGRNSFTPSTAPAMRSWAGKDVNFPITDIEEKNGVVTFNVLGGVPKILAPTNFDVMDMTLSGFTLGWDAVEGATDYNVSISALSASTSTPISENADGSSLPEGWTKSSGISTYTTSGNYVTGSQSFKLSLTGHEIVTGVYPSDVDYIRFWYKSQQASGGSCVTVQGLVGGEWKTVHTVELNASDKDYVTLEGLSQSFPGIRQVKFVYTKAKGNVALDDITVATGGSKAVALPGYTNRSTGGATSIAVNMADILGKVEGIPADQQLFKAELTATNGTDVSRVVEMNFIYSPNSGLTDLTTDTDAPVYYNLQGQKVTPNTPGLYIVKRGATITKQIVR